MEDSQLSKFWTFARGDVSGVDFERWFFAQAELEGTLGSQLHWELLTGNYANKDEVWRMRKSLGDFLQPFTQCECPSLRNVAAVPMGSDGLDERVFSSIDIVTKHGGHQWWLYLAKCSSCDQNWMVAQEERIFDVYFMRRLDEMTARQITEDGIWPTEFLTYEAVLSVGNELSRPCRFLESLSPALVWTAQDLRKERPQITAEEIAHLLGIRHDHAVELLNAGSPL